ncbi:MAG: hypothetical protein QOI63_1644 [Thermoplasmata archaeon]|jgi:hypothetical protein|nr:hypothetical protein [Thermoplasmata archaeon]
MAMDKSNAKMVEKSAVSIADSNLAVDGFTMNDARVVLYFQEVAEGERDEMLRRALIIGVLCLERANTHADVDYLRRETQNMVGDVQKLVAEFGATLIKQVGTGEGQALAPVKLQIDVAQKILIERLEGVKKILTDEIDPAKTTSTLGKALNTVHDLLDPTKTDSIQGRLSSAIDAATGEKGKLAITVKLAVEEAVKPLAERVEKLAKDVLKEEAAEEAVAEIVEATPIKGSLTEARVVETLSHWAQLTGAQVEHVGDDQKPGDILLTVPSISASGHEETIVIEVKDEKKKVGRQAIGEALDERMGERNAHGGIWIAKDTSGLAKEIGDYAEGAGQNGPWIATTEQNLVVAVRHLRVLMRLATIQATKPEVDITAAQGGIDRIRTTIKKFRTINTEAGNLRTSADTIEQTARIIRSEVETTLLDIEASLRQAPGQAT